MASLADPPGPLAGLTDSAQQVAVHVLMDRMKPNICDTRVPTVIRIDMNCSILANQK